jgi:hypothetical protein
MWRTINIASRVESNGEPGKINNTENHDRAISDLFVCEAKGGIVKNKGVMNIYFVHHPKIEET